MDGGTDSRVESPTHLDTLRILEGRIGTSCRGKGRGSARVRLRGMGRSSVGAKLRGMGKVKGIWTSRGPEFWRKSTFLN